MSDLQNIKVKKGQRVLLSYENRDFEVIVIDLDGLGKNQPSLGFGFGMAESYVGLPISTADNWKQGLPNSDEECLKVSSGNRYRVSRILGLDNNVYNVVEVSDWVALAVDVLKKPGKVKKKTRDGIIDFLGWFAVKGFYADAYSLLKGQYTEADSRTVSAWLQVRLAGIAKRNKYTKFLQDNGCIEWYEYANWTDYIYLGLFGMKKRDMVQKWELVQGNKNIGRNYIPETEGLDAVAWCESQVIELFTDNLKQAHDDALKYAKKKFNLDF